MVPVMYYFRGRGVPKDEAVALDWLHKAVDTGSDEGSYVALPQLGMYYLYLRNDAAAVECFREAADYGSEDAQYLLAECYHHGWGVKQDDTEAEKWYHESQHDEGIRKLPMRATVSCW